jgi:hypothetical protein
MNSLLSLQLLVNPIHYRLLTLNHSQDPSLSVISNRGTNRIIPLRHHNPPYN